MSSGHILFYGTGAYSIGFGVNGCEIILTRDALIVRGKGDIVRVNIRDITGYYEEPVLFMAPQIVISGVGHFFGIQIYKSENATSSKQATREFAQKLQDAMTGI